MAVQDRRFPHSLCLLASLSLLASTGAAQSSPEIACLEQELQGPANLLEAPDFGIVLDSRTHRIAVGAPRELVDVPEPDPDVFGGAVWIFDRDPDDPIGQRWKFEVRLVCTAPHAGDRFGHSISMNDSGDSVAVGVPGNFVPGPMNPDTGIVEIFTLSSPGTWPLEAALVPQACGSVAPHDNQYFGSSVALSGTRAVVGSQFMTDGISADALGAAYFFSRTGGSWAQDNCFQPAPTAEDDTPELGYSAAMDGDWAAVGAWKRKVGGTIQGAGSVFIFNLQGTAWVQTQELVASLPDTNSNFGSSVAIDETTLVIGAPGEDEGSVNEVGAVYVFTRNGTTWSQQQRIDSPVSNITAYQFGFAVDVDDDVLLIGNNEDSSDQAFIYYNTGSTYVRQTPTITALTDGTAADFGRAVTITGNTAVVGAPREEVPGNLSSAGGVFVFIPPDGGGVVFYGQAKWSSQTMNCLDPVTQEPCVPPVFCLPHIETEGAPSITSPEDFKIRGDNLVVFDDDPPNQEPLTCGILMWSLAGRANSPLCGGTNYINAAVNYRGLTETDFPEGAGAIDTCLGELTVTLQQLIDENPAIDIGTRINAQYRFMDPEQGVCPNGSEFNGFTDAVEWVVCP